MILDLWCPFNSQYFWKWNVCLKSRIWKCLVSNETNMSNFQPLEVVGRGSETQLQVGENLNYIT